MGTLGAVTAIVIFAVTFFFIATEKVHRVVVVLTASGLVAVLGLVTGEDMFFSHESGIDWNVIFLLLGMMIIVGVIKQTGVFEAMGIWAAQRSGGRPYRLLVLLMIITAVASPVLDNVTIIMLVAPVTLSVCGRLGIPAAPYLIAEVLASNIGGAATLIGDPPNIIIASRADLSFNDFLVHMAPIVIILLVVFTILARFMFRKAKVPSAAKFAEVRELSPAAAIKDRRLLLRCIITMSVVILVFTLHEVIHLEPAVVALLGAGVMVAVSGGHVSKYLAEVEWSTLVFFMGLFIVVGSLVETGVIAHIGHWAVDAVGDNYLLAASGLVFGSAILGAFFDNIPYTTTMAPIVADMVAQSPESGAGLWWAFALGADLGGNGTAVAASANVVMLGIASRAGHPVSFWQFTKYGIVTTAITTVVAWGYVWLRYFALRPPRWSGLVPAPSRPYSPPPWTSRPGTPPSASTAKETSHAHRPNPIAGYRYQLHPHQRRRSPAGRDLSFRRPSRGHDVRHRRTRHRGTFRGFEGRRG